MKPVIISGRVLRGVRYGKKLGFPTANLDRRQLIAMEPAPRLGIYAGLAKINQVSKRYKDKKYKAGIVIGPRDRRGLPKIEAHLLGFSGNLYSRRLSICLISYLRPFRAYRSEAALKAQIKKDISKVKKLIKLKGALL